MTTHQIRNGSLLLYRVFDVGEEINLHAVENILKTGQGEKRVRLSPSKPEALIVKDAPIRVQLGNEQITLAGRTHSCEITATIWSYAAISIRYQVPLTDMSWAELQRISQMLSEAPSSISEVEKSGIRCRELARAIESAITNPAISNQIEDYSIFLFEKIEGITTGQELLDNTDLPALMLGESRETLSNRARVHAFEGLFQYSETDLTLIGWDTAIVFESDGGTDVADVIEFALTHLLEFRVYDDLLDQRLAEVYNSVESSRRGLWRSPFEKIVTEANTRYLEFSEFTDRIDNSLKVVGDYYLATIFRGAARRFRIPDWQSSMERNTKVLAEVSTLLQGELNARKSHLLEAVVILLIFFEIVMAFVRPGH
jgi:hypothetical protein